MSGMWWLGPNLWQREAHEQASRQFALSVKQLYQVSGVSMKALIGLITVLLGVGMTVAVFAFFFGLGVVITAIFLFCLNKVLIGLAVMKTMYAFRVDLLL